MPTTHETSTADLHNAAAHDPLVESLTGPRGKGWGWVLAYGILLVIVGIVALANPLATGAATGILLGFLLLLYGVAALVAGFRAHGHSGRWLEVALGVLALLAGIAVLLNPVAGALSLVWLLGAWLVVAGAFQLLFAIRSRANRFWTVVMGVLDIVLGLFLLLSDPGTALSFLAIVVGISFAVRGVFLIWLAFQLRKL
jgi:uncharacterized membrane protein HdeD (DUF308 family)